MSKFIDRTGHRYGRLLVIGRTPNTGHQTIWECQCDCGKTTHTAAYLLSGGQAMSCGCLGREKLMSAITSHGQRRTKMYSVWTNIKSRCYNPKRHNYRFYGGRGITMCDEWKSNFASFYKWTQTVEHNPGDTIDRIDVNGPYAPENCRFVPLKQQMTNRRNTVMVLFNGTKTPLAEVARITGNSYKQMHARYHRGDPIAPGVAYALGVAWMDAQEAEE